MPEKTRVVIIGGGYAGVRAAQRLARLLKAPARAEITLIDKNPFHTLMTELHEVAGGRSSPESVMVSFERIFPDERVRVVTDRVLGVDFEAKSVRASGGTFPYDYLVLGTGSEPEYFGIPGVAEHSLPLWSLDDALAIRARVEAKFLEASRQVDPERRRQALTFVVAGAGFTGIELAGELAEQRRAMCERYHLDPAECRVIVVEALPAILTMLDNKLRKRAEFYLNKLEVEIKLDSPIVGAAEGEIRLKDGSVLRADTFVWTCGVGGSAFAGALGLGIGKRDRIQVDPFMRSVDRPEVFVVGDANWFLEEGKPLPQIVETSIQTADCAARAIAADVLKKGAPKPFKSSYHGFMVSIGSRYAVQNLKLPQATLALGGLAGGLIGYLLIALVMSNVLGWSEGSFTGWKFAAGFTSPWCFLALAAPGLAVGGLALVLRSSAFAMGMKHLINMHYLWGIAGFNGVFNYLRHAFFHRDDGRSFWPGRLVGARVQGLWVTILRIFTGAMWFIEGLGKLNWLDPKNSGWVNQFLFGIAPKVQAAADAVAAASEDWEAAAEPVAEAVTAANEGADAAATAVVDAAGQLAAAAKSAASAAGGIFLPALNKPTALYKWIIKVFVGDGSQAWQLFFAYLFRLVIVLGEVGIGLALFGGAFTFLASGGSILLCLMFILSGMATREIFWYLCAGLTLLGASGRAAGLDSWIIPWVDRLWRGSSLGRLSKLYPNEPLIRRKR